MSDEGAFRFSYFTDQYAETYSFYAEQLGFPLAHSWDRNADDKGALFRAGAGLIEILHRPEEEEHRSAGLDYRIPQGVFMGIQVRDAGERFAKYQSAGIPFEQEITDQDWGHRSFSVVEPNGLILFFFQEQF